MRIHRTGSTRRSNLCLSFVALGAVCGSLRFSRVGVPVGPTGWWCSASSVAISTLIRVPDVSDSLQPGLFDGI